MSNPDAPWRDEATLREKYSELRNMYAVGDELGCSHNCVREWMIKFGIDRNPRPKPVSQRTDSNGYERFQIHEGTCLYHHQLLAVAAGWDPHEVFDPSTHVHHLNGLKWDNRPSNIEVLDASDHMSEHADELHKLRERDAGGRFV